MKRSDIEQQENKRRAALLQQKTEEYIEKMNSSSINFGLIPTDRLLIIDAINRWSGGAMGEGGAVKIVWGGNDPAFATEEEAKEILKRACESPSLIYPISNFSLSEDGEDLRYSILNSEYKLRCHIDKSYSSAVNAAEVKRVSSVEACHQLWLFSATEDCIAYLNHQLDSYGLELEESEYESVRRLFSGFLLENFSVGQIWNAVWRSVRHAAALSNRQYYNNAKAARLIPKKIDKVLTQALQDDGFESYDRLISLPVSAVLMLFKQRFNVGDSTSGQEVRNALAADAKNYKSEQFDSPSEEEESQERNILRGNLYFLDRFTSLDEIFVSCLASVDWERDSPDWEDSGGLGSMFFEGVSGYKFNGNLFYSKISELIDAKKPSDSEIAARAEELSDDVWAHERAYRELIATSLRLAGVEKNAARFMAWSISFTPEPDELVAIMRGIPLPSGLVAIDISSSYMFGTYVEHKEIFGTGMCRIDLPEGLLEPQGDYRQLLVSMLKGGDDSVAEILAYAVSNAIRCTDEIQRASLWEKVGNKLVKIAGERRAEYGKD